VKYYKSTMLLGEISQTPRKDSMGMEWRPFTKMKPATRPRFPSTR
jgi:hypothetical protein